MSGEASPAARAACPRRDQAPRPLTHCSDCAFWGSDPAGEVSVRDLPQSSMLSLPACSWVTGNGERPGSSFSYGHSFRLGAGSGRGFAVSPTVAAHCRGQGKQVASSKSASPPAAPSPCHPLSRAGSSRLSFPGPAEGPCPGVPPLCPAAPMCPPGSLPCGSSCVVQTLSGCHGYFLSPAYNIELD